MRRFLLNASRPFVQETVRRGLKGIIAALIVVALIWDVCITKDRVLDETESQ